MARCELLLGDTAAAEAALRPLFAPTKSGRGRSAAASAFTLGMGSITNKGFGGAQHRRKAAAAWALAAGAVGAKVAPPGAALQCQGAPAAEGRKRKGTWPVAPEEPGRGGKAGAGGRGGGGGRPAKRRRRGAYGHDDDDADVAPDGTSQDVDGEGDTSRDSDSEGATTAMDVDEGEGEGADAAERQQADSGGGGEGDTDDTVGEPANEEPAAAQRPPRFLWATHPEVSPVDV